MYTKGVELAEGALGRRLEGVGLAEGALGWRSDENASYSAMLHTPGTSSASGINSINSRNSGIGSNMTSTDSAIDSTHSRNSGIVSTTNSV